MLATAVSERRSPRTKTINCDPRVEQLVRENLALVHWVLRNFFPRQPPRDPDLLQEGRIGLLRAAQKFDSSRGHTFGNYAVWWIRDGIGRAILNRCGGIIHIPHDPVPGTVFPSFERLDDVELLSPAREHEDFERRELLKPLLATLSARERFVVSGRYGLGSGVHRTLREIGKDLGVTHETVRKIELQALEKMRGAAGGRTHAQLH